MRTFVIVSSLGLAVLTGSFFGIFSGSTHKVTTTHQSENMKSVYDFKVTDISGNSFDFASLKGKKIMIVNTASECGLTPQYTQLEAVYKKYAGEKFTIIGFPANNFGAQEPGSNEEIKSFCTKNYGVSFPMMSKISVTGDDQHPLFRWLTHKSENGVADCEVKWNFHKFLVDENGKFVKDIHPRTLPDDPEIIQWISGK